MIQQITREMFKLYERKRIVWMNDVLEDYLGAVCHIETIENSIIVSPSTDWTNFTAVKAEKPREEPEEGKREGGERWRERKETGDRSESTKERSIRESYRSHRHRSRSSSASRSRSRSRSQSRSHSHSKPHSHSRRHSHRHHHHHFSFCYSKHELFSAIAVSWPFNTAECIMRCKCAMVLGHDGREAGLPWNRV